MKALKLLLPVVVLAMLVAGISMSPMAQMSENVLKAAHDAEWTGLDPHVASTVSSFHVLANVVESLTTNNDNLELTPLLATDWAQSDDGLSWTFNLREGVSFSNGEAMTAEHVVFSMNRILDPDTGSGRVAAVGGPGTVWEAVDDHTVSSDHARPQRHPAHPAIQPRDSHRASR